MSNVYITAGLDDQVRVRHTERTNEYAVEIGNATVYLAPAKAAELRAVLAAALDEPRTSGGTDVSG